MDLVQPIVSHALVLFIPIQKAWCFSSIPYHGKDAMILFFETQPLESCFFGGLAQDSQRSTLLCLLNAQIKGVPHHAWLLKNAAALETIERKPTINCKHTLDFPKKSQESADIGAEGVARAQSTCLLWDRLWLHSQHPQNAGIPDGGTLTVLNLKC